MVFLQTDVSKAMTIKLSSELPPDPVFDPKHRRAPDRGFDLDPQETVIAIKNALRYVPQNLHAKLAPEFLNELITRGRVYAYRYRPPGAIRAKPVDEYKGVLEARALQLMMDNNVSFEVALYPYELVTYGESGQVCQNWMQFQLIKKYLETMTEDQTLVVSSGHPVGLFPFSQECSSGHPNEWSDGGYVRHSGRISSGCGSWGCELRANDSRGLDVYWPAGDRPRHLHHAAERWPTLSRYSTESGHTR